MKNLQKIIFTLLVSSTGINSLSAAWSFNSLALRFKTYKANRALEQSNNKSLSDNKIESKNGDSTIKADLNVVANNRADSITAEKKLSNSNMKWKIVTAGATTLTIGGLSAIYFGTQYLINVLFSPFVE